MKKIGILYICTGKYTIFWEDFYKSCEKHFLVNEDFQREYFVFTDAETILFENEAHVHRIYQEPLSWPYITLFRFKIFNQSKELYQEMDYLYFFNANMLLIHDIDLNFLPSATQSFSFVQHPGFYNASVSEFTYERNMSSKAGIDINRGTYYLMGGLNGGEKTAYLAMCEELEKNIDKDLESGIIAIWHDESHLNRYALDNQDEIKVLDPSYGYPEDWDLPFDAKIIIRDKNKFGGHKFLRNDFSVLHKIWRKLFKW